MRNLWIGKLASAMVIARQKKEREKKEREEGACSRRVGTFQLNCKLKRIFYSRVVSTIGSDRKYSKTRQRLLSRIKFAISVPFSFSIISSMISQTSTVNRILFADFQPALFRNCFQYGEWRASILPSFYSSPSISNIRDSIVLVILHELPFPWIARSRLKRTGTRRSTGPFLPKFLLPWYSRPRVKAIPCTDCKKPFRVKI